MKQVKVQLTLEWSFDKKEWSEEKKLWKDLESDPQIVLGYDVIHTLYMLNDLDFPSLVNCKVTENE